MASISHGRTIWGILSTLLVFSSLGAQTFPKIEHLEINEKDTGLQIELLFSGPLGSEDVSSWIEQRKWFILNFYNIEHPNSGFGVTYTKFPVVEILQVKTSDNALQLSFHIGRPLGSFDVIRLDEENRIIIVLVYADFVEPKDVNPSFIFPELKDAQRKHHPLSWKDNRARTSIRILCDTKGLPIYVDNQIVGKTPLTDPIDVLPGWHKVGYFPQDFSQDSEIQTSKEKMMFDILRMGLLDIYIEEGKEETIVLSYQTLDEDVIDYNKRFMASTWVGLSMFFMMILLMSWGLI
jgi:hypothetical protein